MSRRILIFMKFLILIVLIICLSLLHVSSEQTYNEGETLSENPISMDLLNNIQKGGIYVSECS